MIEHELLRRYAVAGDDGAFREIVTQHVDLVYSVAKRQVGSDALAQEIAQMVFCELARRAGRMPADVPLVGWLHVVTRRTAIDVVRQEARRSARERQLANDPAMSGGGDDRSEWVAIEPVLDEALESLRPADRTAVLLRYFGNKSFRDVGHALGLSEDAAQKRVSRALEQLRGKLVRRGVTVSAAGLAVELSAHAVQTAPALLAQAVARAVVVHAGAAAAGAAASAATSVVVPKGVLLAVTALTMGVGLYEGVGYFRQSADLAAVRRQAAEQTAELGRLMQQRQKAEAELDGLEKAIDARLAAGKAPAPGSDAALEAQMRTWLARRARLKQLVKEWPGAEVPELKLLDEAAWFSIASSMPLETDEDIRKALAALRTDLTHRLANQIGSALLDFVKAHAGYLPTRLEELAPYMSAPMDEAIWARFTLLQPGKLAADLSRADQTRVIVSRPVDVEYDLFHSLGTSLHGVTSAMGYDVVRATKAFKQANGGREAQSAAELAPYLPWPVATSAVQKWLDQTKAGRSP